MGCGQSKINLYPRRNKNGGKGNSAKKSGGASKESDDEEGNAGAAKPDDADDDAADKNKQLLPLVAHAHTMEVSESQQDFFKMLDDKIEQGRDYDSSSETEIKIEQERRKMLLDQWPTPSQPICPSTPVRRRVLHHADRQSSPGAGRRCCRQLPDGLSPPPPRRAHSAQANHSEQRYAPDWLRDELNKSPNKRLNNIPPWKNQIKPCNHKPKRSEINENQTINKTEILSSQESSSTFSTQSSTHSVKSQQPYITQIIAQPTSQQLSPPATPKLIAPPEEYQDPQTDHEQPNKCEASRLANQQSPQPPIYFIHGSSNQNLAQDLQQQRQQTAFHLQQYVAMKQAQQHMFTYIQRGPHTVFPGVEYTQIDPSKAHEYEEYYSNTTVTNIRPHSAPTTIGPVRPIPILPGYGGIDRAHMPQGPMWTPMPAVVSSMGPWVPGQLPQDLAYYPQSQYLSMYRPNSAGSAGTLTRYKDKKVESSKDNVCQINLVRQKPVGQIVSGGQELTVCTNSSDSASPASVSTDSGVSPGNNVPKNTVFTPAPPPPTTLHKETHNHVRSATTVETKNKKNKSTFVRSLKNSKSLDSS